MFKAFELTKKEALSKRDFVEPYKIGKSKFVENQKIINTKLEEFLLPNGNFDASAMQDNWFPQIPADIFLSHAHADEETALIIAGILHRDLGLNVFIDSCVWGDSNELLNKIDKELCWDEKRKVYDYKNRNYTTTHVHIMLASALHEMIYNTEAVFFLNTNKSAKVNTKDLVKRTESGWIYSEIKMCKLVEKRTPYEHSSRQDSDDKFYSFNGVNESHNRFEWKLDTSDFHQLNWSDINNWKSNKNDNEHPLDTLYKQFQIVK
jgi:hypothetical protein